MTGTVSVVIPTVGRPSLCRAVQSVLDQTWPVLEVIVVADTESALRIPHDDRIRLLNTSSRGGPARSRQIGIDAARGSVIALLDDDDEWRHTKLERQLGAVAATTDSHWVVSSRILLCGTGVGQRVLPRRLIRPGESVVDYLFRFEGLRLGGSALQTSTLCFSAELAREVRWDAHAGAVHDEPSWLIDAQRAVPDLRILQLPDVLSTYVVGHASESRSAQDRTEDYLHWGFRYLHAESRRVLGDYMLTSVVSAAVSARSLRGWARALRAGLRHGRPGPFALLFAALNGVRIVALRTLTVLRR